jgi:phosphoglycolate phosphatase
MQQARDIVATAESQALFRGAALAFDLDGTLVDSAPDLVRSLNAVIEPLGLSPVPLSDVRAMVGRGSRALLMRAFEREEKTVEDEALQEHVARFIEIYDADIAARTTIFPDVAETLDAMAEAGADLSVCTNKPSRLADSLLEALDLKDKFSRIIGPERTQAKKPAADHVHDALGAGWSRAAMIGDSAPDVDAARAAGVPVLVLSHGYSEEPADALGADRVLHAFRDVPEALVRLWRTQAD